MHGTLPHLEQKNKNNQIHFRKTYQENTKCKQLHLLWIDNIMCLMKEERLRYIYYNGHPN